MCDIRKEENVQAAVNNALEKKEERKEEEHSDKETEGGKEEHHKGKEHTEKSEIKMPTKAKENSGVEGKKRNVHVPATSTCKCSIF